MSLLIDPHSGVPAYRQLVEQIRLQIASGVLPVGSEVPSTRAVAQRLGINPMTVSKAYSLLEAEGLLLHRPGLPLTVCERPEAALLDDREHHVRHLLQPAAQAAIQFGIPVSRATVLLREAMASLRRSAETAGHGSISANTDQND